MFSTGVVVRCMLSQSPGALGQASYTQQQLTNSRNIAAVPGSRLDYVCHFIKTHGLVPILYVQLAKMNIDHSNGRAHSWHNRDTVYKI